MSYTFSVARQLIVLLLAAAFFMLGGCSTIGGSRSVDNVSLIYAQGDIPEDQLLDVNIRIFDYASRSEVDEDDFYDERLMKTESRYMPYHLKQTLQNTGQWGSVHVVPTRPESMDVFVSGRIMESNGELLEVEVTVSDATGRQWFNTRYETEIDESRYVGARKDVNDPFQAFYNQVVNDMLAYRQTLSPRQLGDIRRIANMRFAQSLSPDAFRGYLSTNGDGEYQLQRLPADDDQQMTRILRLQEREFMFLDTLNLYYANLYDTMWEPYLQWRESYLAELRAREELESQARTRQILGVLAIAAAVANQAYGNNDNYYSSAATVALATGGVMAFKSGMDISESATIHTEAIKELADSFNDDIDPVVIEVDGKTTALQGTARSQYQQWQQMLREIYFTETGFTPETGGDKAVPSAI